MGRNASLEQEVKLEAPLELALPDLRDLVGGAARLPAQNMVTRYFDTADNRLWGQGLTLRHRKTDDGDEGTWTLKLPNASKGPALRRTEVTWPGLDNEIPADASEVLRGVVRREPLRQLTTLQTTRQRIVLRDDQDRELAELDDDVVVVVGGPHDGARFRQVELEFHDQQWDGDRVLRLLEKAGARVESSQKLAKAIDLPAPSPPAPLDAHSTVADVVQASLRSGFDRLVAHDWQLRLALPEPAPHDVHQARVATRRLRSDLKTFGAVLDPVWLAHTQDDLKWVGEVLGELRDLDVLSQGLSDPPLAVRQRLAVQRMRAGQRLADALTSKRYVNLVDRLHAGSEMLPLASGSAFQAQRPATEVLPSLVAAQWRTVRRQVRRADTNPSSTQLHQIRIKSKRFRYAAEAATPIIGKQARRTASAAERVQTVLGKHHDAVAAEAWLRHEWTGRTETGGFPAASPGVTLEVGRLIAEERQRQRRAERHWGRAWDKLRRKKSRRWISHH
ncbi:MAG TPA: CYTH and CHAD domain-containing protein [Acidimicrobiales bacterium]|jgi:CHAD domain-containing protein|nr:CYTH and CHAD domain-containing protein [Acidimicrobiales bacterium]